MNSAEPKAVRTMDESFQKLLETDTNAEYITDAMRRNQPMPPGPSLIPVERYTNHKYHELEKQHLWSRVWQMACHEDDFPHVGDVVPYDITDKSYIIVRVSDDEYKAYYNSCLHRGRKLREARAHGLNELRCPFHGWAWNLDGSLKQVPCAYDYNGLVREEESLPEVKLARWGRFIFINPDPDAAPFEDFVGDLATQFEVFPYERRYKRAHVAKVIRANWKVVQEAFMESYHVIMTHPQILMGGVHDSDTKYDAFENYSRAIRCGALDSEGTPEWDALPSNDGVIRARHPLSGWVYEDCGDEVVLVTTPKGESAKFDVDANWLEGDLLDANPHMCNLVGGLQIEMDRGDPRMTAMFNRDAIKAAKEKLGPGASQRQVSAEVQRTALKDVIPSVADKIPDAELSSSMFFTLFPNWHPWGSFNQINYRFRPNRDNPDEAIMECMYLAPIPDDGKCEPVREIHWLGPDDDWTLAPELGGLAKVFNQDTRNLQYVYEGMKTTARENLRVSDYNELKLRHFHQLYEKWVVDAE